MTWFRFQILISEGLRKRISSSLRYLFLSIPFPHLLRKSWVKYAQDLPAWQTDACKWVCSHTSPLSAYPAPWCAASLNSGAARLPAALSCEDALETHTVTELTEQLFSEVTGSYRNRRSFSVACFHEKHKIFVSSRHPPFYII